MADPRFPRARKRFGQHFLEAAWVTRLLNAVEPTAADTFLEIGPGRGALTRVLAPRVKQIIAVEIDRVLAAALPALVPANVRVVEQDFLETDVEQLLNAADEGRRLSDATLMLQKEVVDRVVARPGGGDYGTLAIQVALVADVQKLLTLPPGAFRPPPKVTSAVVGLRFRPAVVDVGSQSVFEKVVRGIFLQRRKTLANALAPVADALGHSAAAVIAQAGVDGRKRPEALTLEEIACICRAML